MLKKRKSRNAPLRRSQIGRAQRFIRLHMSSQLGLDDIAREAGASPFHFVRIFLAYTGETPFDFLRRVRLAMAVRLLQEDPYGSITEIALSVGYQTPSAFDKLFKSRLGMSPREFRNLGKDRQYELIYRLTKPLESEEEGMKLNMDPKPEMVGRPSFHYLYLERTGPFAEIAPGAWQEAFRLLNGHIDRDRFTEMLGLSTIDKTRQGEDSMIYQAGVGLSSKPTEAPRGLHYRKIEAGRYAQFLLVGPYSQIWIAFSQIFRTLTESAVPLRNGFCIEKYLSDPLVTPGDQLQTQILIPVA